jgi:hypothetical protein
MYKMDDLLESWQQAKAISDVQHRSWVLKKSAWDYIRYLSVQVQGQTGRIAATSDQIRFNSEADRALEKLLLDAEQWYKAISRNALPREIRRHISSSLNKDLKLAVEALRDIREHWEDTRKYYEDSRLEVPKNQKRILWLKKHHPDAHPWSSGFTLGVGYYIAGLGVVNIQDILLEVGRVEEVIPSL